MDVTFDRNVLSRIATAKNYSSIEKCNDDMEKLKYFILNKTIQPYLSEATLSIEALPKAEKIDSFFREWATNGRLKKSPVLPEAEYKRLLTFYDLGVKILHCPRIVLPPLHEIPKDKWANDINYQPKERHERMTNFSRNCTSNSFERLKDFGSELAVLHKLPAMNNNEIDSLKNEYEELLGSEPPAELEIFKKRSDWLNGLVKESDNLKKFKTKNEFLGHARKIISDWFDEDILASHYGYGFDVLCSNDDKESGILNPANRIKFKNEYNITILKSDELVKKISEDLSLC